MWSSQFLPQAGSFGRVLPKDAEAIHENGLSSLSGPERMAGQIKRWNSGFKLSRKQNRLAFSKSVLPHDQRNRYCGGLWLCQHFSLWEHGAKHAAYQRTGNQKLYRQSHNEIAGDICEPISRYSTPVSGVECALTGTVERHNHYHSHYHSAGNTENFFQRAVIRLDQITECKPFCKLGDQNQSQHMANK